MAFSAPRSGRKPAMALMRTTAKMTEASTYSPSPAVTPAAPSRIHLSGSVNYRRNCLSGEVDRVDVIRSRPNFPAGGGFSP